MKNTGKQVDQRQKEGRISPAREVRQIKQQRSQGRQGDPCQRLLLFLGEFAPGREESRLHQRMPVHVTPLLSMAARCRSHLCRPPLPGTLVQCADQTWPSGMQGDRRRLQGIGERHAILTCCVDAQFRQPQTRGGIAAAESIKITEWLPNDNKFNHF